MQITKIHARQIIDSRGQPTLEAEVYCEGGGWGRAAVPSGASTGHHEAHELRDEGDAYAGKGVSQAIANINEAITPVLLGLSVDDQFKIDQTLCELDGTENKSRLGANAILGVSLAVAHAAASTRSLPLFQHLNDIAGNPPMTIPLPMCNVLNGGQHARNASDIQEYMLIPTSANSYAEAMKMVMEIFATLKKILQERNLATTLGDEGGFAPSVSSNTETLDLLLEAITAAGYKAGTDVNIGLDVAANEFLTDDGYHLTTENRTLSASELNSYVADMAARYPIISIEDALAEDAWEDWREHTEQLGHLQLVGDDLLVTNQSRLARAINEGVANAILIKPNQIGTLTETIQTIAAAQAANWRTVISHRSGETEDVTIAHLAVGAGLGQIKTGSVARGERTAKHNELLRIEDTAPELSLAKPFA